MSDVRIMIHPKPTTECPADITWLSAGNKFIINKKTLLEVERIVDVANNTETMRMVLHLLNYNRIAPYEFTETIYWQGVVVTPLSIQFINDKPQRMLLHIEQRGSVMELIKDNT